MNDDQIEELYFKYAHAGGEIDAAEFEPLIKEALEKYKDEIADWLETESYSGEALTLANKLRSRPVISNGANVERENGESS